MVSIAKQIIPVNADRDNWVAKSVRLKYMLGEVTLFTVDFPAMVLETHFTSLRTDLNETLPPFERLSQKVETFMIRSHPVEGELLTFERIPGAIRYIPAQYRRHYIDMRGSFKDYLGKFSSKSRSTLSRKVRKFADFSGGEIDWREYKNSNDIDEFYGLASELSKKTYQERLLNVGLPRGEDFQQEMRELAGRNELRGYLLFHDHKPVAYLYCPVTDGILFYRHLGFDPEYGSWSPGTVLQYLVLERLFEESRYRMFDFTAGQGPHKEFFSTGSIQCADVYYFRNTIRNRVLISLHAVLGNISRLTVSILERLGIKARIKKLLRSK